MFWLEPGLPNSLAPGKRPRTTLSPSLALRDGEPWLAFGTPGGDMQDQWSLLFFLRHVHHGLDLQAAIDAPAWHTTHFPSSFWPRESEPGRLYVESRVGDRTIAELRRRGHDVSVQDAVEPGPASARSAATPTARCVPAPTRAGCRATPSVAEHRRPGGDVLRFPA